MPSNAPNQSELHQFVNAIGAMTETLSLFRNNLLKQGFTREESMELTRALMLYTLSQKEKDDAN